MRDSQIFGFHLIDDPVPLPNDVRYPPLEGWLVSQAINNSIFSLGLVLRSVIPNYGKLLYDYGTLP
eukprot:3306558-Ditylum_brightwellii.AAC.1